MVQRRSLIAGWLILSALLMMTATARADCPARLTQCVEVVDQCKTALEARKREVELCRLGLQQSQSTNSQLNEELEQKNKQLEAWYRNPWLLLAIGLVGGVALTR